MLTEEVINGSKKYNIPKEVIDNEIRTLVQELEADDGFNPHQPFDPSRHILYKLGDHENIKTLSLKELGIYKTHVQPISEVAVTNPFPLFTEEACKIMKWEAFQRDNVEKYGKIPIMSKGTNSTDFQICGYTNNSPFTVAAWKHPKTQEIVNKFAGVRLKIMFDYEIAHINASLVNQTKQRGGQPKRNGSKNDDNSKAVFDWHYDSNSFSMVLMLSTNDNMKGGKTGIKTGSEEVVYVEGPKVGYATIIQGRVVKHIATKPVSNDERISSIVGYIPESLELPDTTVLTTFRPSVSPRSLHNEYYPQWIDYRFKRIEDRLKKKRGELMKYSKDGRRFDQRDVVQFCEDIASYLHKSWDEFETVAGNEIFPPKLFSTPYKDL